MNCLYLAEQKRLEDTSTMAQTFEESVRRLPRSTDILTTHPVSLPSICPREMKPYPDQKICRGNNPNVYKQENG